MLDSKAFTYSTPQQPPAHRLFIRSIEKLTGQAKIWKLYKDYSAGEGENFWDAALRRLNVRVVCDPAKLETVPRTGPLVVVANHPFGVVDGLIITHLMKKVRQDFKVLTNSVLCRAPEAAVDLLPIDFSETKEALEINLSTRKKAREILKNGGCIVVFPAGGVSTIQRWNDNAAQDTAWQPFIGRLVQEAKCDVLPLFFEGQNSRLFQCASLISPTLRLALFFKEVKDKIGADIGVRIGEVIPHQALEAYSDRAALCAFLRARTYALGGLHDLAPPKPAYRTDHKKR